MHELPPAADELAKLTWAYTPCSSRACKGFRLVKLRFCVCAPAGPVQQVLKTCPLQISRESANPKLQLQYLQG